MQLQRTHFTVLLVLLHQRHVKRQQSRGPHLSRDRFEIDSYTTIWAREYCKHGSAGFEIAHLRQSESVPFSRDKTYRLLLMQPTHLCFLASCLLPPSPHRERLLCISVYLCKTRHMHPHVPMLHVLHCFLDMQNMQDMQCGVWVKTCSPLQRIQHLQTCTT